MINKVIIIVGIIIGIAILGSLIGIGLKKNKENYEYI